MGHKENKQRSRRRKEIGLSALLLSRRASVMGARMLCVNCATQDAETKMRTHILVISGFVRIAISMTS